MPGMTPLLTWDWPETPILLGVVLVMALLTQLVVNLGIKRATKLALERAESHSTGGLTGRAAHVLARASGYTSERHAQRTRTMSSILRSVSVVVIVILTVLTAMSIIGVPLAPLLASAGIGGIAIGFGAQALVKDYITGIFLIIEDQFGIGDVVKIGEVTGTVEDITLRVTRVRDMSGMVWYIRNGEIVNVGNLSQGHSTGTIDIPVAYDADANKAITVLKGVVEEVDGDEKWKPSLIEPPQVLGVDSISGGTMTLRILVKSPPNQQYGVSREIRERAQIALVKAGIPGPKVIPGL